MSPPRFIYAITHERISFLFKANIPLYVQSTVCFSIHPLMDIWIVFTRWLLCCYCFMDAQISLQNPAFSFPNVYLKVIDEIIMVILFSIFKGMGKAFTKTIPQEIWAFQRFLQITRYCSRCFWNVKFIGGDYKMAQCVGQP